MLVNAIARFAASGMDAREVAVLITSAVRQRAVIERLVEWGVDAGAAQRDGWLHLFDPADFRDSLFVDELPDRARYRNAMNALLAETGRAGARTVRVYADLVDQLWREGNMRAVVRMEEVSQEYCVEHGLKALCGYRLDGFEADSYRPELEAVCRLHGRVHEPHDESALRAAVDLATAEVLGTILSESFRHSRRHAAEWWGRLPMSRRTMIWLQSNVPSAMARVLARARHHYR